MEFALVVPILLLMIAGVFEFSRAWNAQQVLTDTAREALRSSVVDDPDFTVERMRALVDGALERASLDPERAEVSMEGWKAGTGTRARLRIDYRYEFGVVGPLVDWAVGAPSVTLSTAFVMRNE